MTQDDKDTEKIKFTKEGVVWSLTPLKIEHIKNLAVVVGAIWIINDLVNHFLHDSAYFYIDYSAMILASLLAEIIMYDKYKNQKIKKVIFCLISAAVVIVFLGCLIDLTTRIIRCLW